MAEIQFGVSVVQPASQDGFVQLVRRADELGFDVLTGPDHLGALSPFTALAVAGTISERLRLRTYVLNYAFWNAALLAREVATLDALSGGRVELGLGAGWAKPEFDDAGIPWLPFLQRIEGMGELLTEVRERLGDPGHQPQPVQQPVPVMIGAMSEAGLAIAARHAEIIGFAGLRQRKGAPLGELTIMSAADMADRVAKVRREAAGRDYRSDVLLQTVVLDQDPEKSAADIAERLPGVSVEEVLDTPVMLLAEDADQAAAEVHRRREVYGFDSFTTHAMCVEALGEVIAAYRAAYPES